MMKRVSKRTNKSAKDWIDILDADNNELTEQPDDLNIQGLAKLTVLSAIFMPITFLAGIWGMNSKYKFFDVL